MNVLSVKRILSRMIENLLTSDFIPFAILMSIGITIFILIVFYGIMGLIKMFGDE